jgi:DNA segregation ATPase FtsK/SpoIIIE-like protein
MEELKKQAIKLFKQYPNDINTSLIQRKLRIGIIKTNKLLEALENDGVISMIDKDLKRKLLIY